MYLHNLLNIVGEDWLLLTVAKVTLLKSVVQFHPFTDFLLVDFFMEHI